ncbi:MAG: diguanylate cyclase [Lachnospiraceae bacterium]|nr:diguanylate cyclase [Lachnospiraceae bacterium]
MKKILIVDDQMITLKMTSHILASQYQTVCASSGSEAIELYRKERPDMVLTDLHMPEMSGFELQSALHEEFAENIPIMFMTADSSDETESKGFENGAVDFIRKPFRADVLLRRVANILQSVEQIRGLRKAAETDPMTGLLNKASSQEEIGEIIKGTPGVLMMIDLDSFKLVNDIYGHNMGDKVLIRFAEIIRSAIRAADIAGRIGGDEFIAFCQHVKSEEVIAEKVKYINDELLKSALEYMGDDMRIPLGASVGAVYVPDEGTDFITIFKKADKALYKVKQNGKHGYSFYHDSSRVGHDTVTVTTGIQSEMAILAERSREKGAFALPYDQFKLIYRFLMRVESNYHKENRLIIFTLKSKDKEEIDKDLIYATQRFYDTACSSLRASDVVTLRGKNQVMVLLLEANLVDSKMVIDRVVTNWQEAEKGYELISEMELIKEDRR